MASRPQRSKGPNAKQSSKMSALERLKMARENGGRDEQFEVRGRGSMWVAPRTLDRGAPAYVAPCLGRERRQRRRWGAVSADTTTIAAAAAAAPPRRVRAVERGGRRLVGRRWQLTDPTKPTTPQTLTPVIFTTTMCYRSPLAAIIYYCQPQARVPNVYCRQERAFVMLS